VWNLFIQLRILNRNHRTLWITSFFGSVLRDDFTPDSDIDVLVSFAPDAKWSFFDLSDKEDDLSAILVDNVLPFLPYPQFVLSYPIQLRY
jgi:predicted nucleotidyltransferase